MKQALSFMSAYVFLLCYICHPHGTKPGARAAKGPPTCGSLLPTVRVRGNGSTHVR